MFADNGKITWQQGLKLAIMTVFGFFLVALSGTDSVMSLVNYPKEVLCVLLVLTALLTSGGDLETRARFAEFCFPVVLVASALLLIARFITSSAEVFWNSLILFALLFSFSTILFLIRFLWRIRKGRAIVLLLFAAASLLSLTGCVGTEPEDGAFPLAMGLEQNGDIRRVYYALADTSKNASENDENQKGQEKDLDWSYEAGSFSEAEDAAGTKDYRALDLNHVRAVILSESLMENVTGWAEALSYLNEPQLCADAYVFCTDDVSAVMQLNGTRDENLGEQIDRLVEHQSGQGRMLKVRDLLAMQYSVESAESIPQIRAENGQLSVTSFLE